MTAKYVTEGRALALWRLHDELANNTITGATTPAAKGPYLRRWRARNARAKTGTARNAEVSGNKTPC